MRLRRARSWRQAIASLALVFFAFQSYLTQTHIHLLWQDAPDAYAQAIGAGLGAQPAHGKLPPADNPASCPICQDMLLAGHFTTPAAISLLMPAQIATMIAIAAATPVFVAAVSHNWRGRAPPQH